MLVLTEIGLAQLDRGRSEPARAALEHALAHRLLTRVTPDQADIVAGLARANAERGMSDSSSDVNHP